MTTAHPAAPFVAANIRSLCSSQASISDVCRRIGISRQQFNKYLSGQHIPSRRNLGLIASHFCIAEEELYLAPTVFAKKLGSRPLAVLKSLGDMRRFREFALCAEASVVDAGNYVGVYERYHCSSIYEGMILRSIVAIRAIGGLICHSSVERFPSKDDPKKADAMFHYRGFIFAFGSRLFMIDFESDQRNEMTAAILAPRIRTGSTLLFGLTMGVAASVAREPFATRVAFKRISEKRLRPENLRRATALKPGDASIPKDIASYLGADKRILRAVDGALRTALKEMADETVGP